LDAHWYFPSRRCWYCDITQWN